MKFQRGVNASQVNQAAQHKLFVEGKDNQEIDAVILQKLLNANGLAVIEVESMGHVIMCEVLHKLCFHIIELIIF